MQNTNLTLAYVLHSLQLRCFAQLPTAIWALQPKDVPTARKAFHLAGISTAMQLPTASTVGPQQKHTRLKDSHALVVRTASHRRTSQEHVSETAYTCQHHTRTAARVHCAASAPTHPAKRQTYACRPAAASSSSASPAALPPPPAKTPTEGVLQHSRKLCQPLCQPAEVQHGPYPTCPPTVHPPCPRTMLAHTNDPPTQGNRVDTAATQELPHAPAKSLPSRQSTNRRAYYCRPSTPRTPSLSSSSPVSPTSSGWAGVCC